MRQDRRHGPRDRRKRLPLLRLPVEQFGLTGNDQIREYLEKLSTPRSLAVSLIYQYGDHRDLLTLSNDVDGAVFRHGIDFARREYAATKLLLKADFLDLGIDRKKVALDGGKAAEQTNLLTNKRLRDLREGRSSDPEFNGIIHSAARTVARILGPLDKALTMIYDHGWTPGRSSAVKSSACSAPHKYQAKLEVSASALGMARVLVNSSPMWAACALGADGPCSVLDSAFCIVDHNTAITVPKNAKTDRLICYEPHMNIRLQRSVGVYLARRLLNVDIDLNDQSPNQVLAKWGSETGGLATLDLSMASDTLAKGLVWDLLPSDWYDFLDSLRSKYTLWPDGPSLNEKFSSMGNGFTFELETICFYALCVAASKKEWALVYGDDIVVDSSDYELVISALSKAGFSVNATKSFGLGRFRESCGEDYYAGVSFSAPHLSRKIETVEDWILFHNQVYTWLMRVPLHVSWSRMLKRWRNVLNGSLQRRSVKAIPLGPIGSGDGHFFSTFDEARPSRHPDGWDGYTFSSIIKVFSRGLVNYETLDGNMPSLDLNTGVVFNQWSLLCTALGPRGSYEVRSTIMSKKHVSERRGSLFSTQWPSVIYFS